MMMCNLIKLIWIHMMAIALLGNASAENPRIATVDMQKIFKDYHLTLAAQERFDAEHATMHKRILERNEVLRRIGEQLATLQKQLDSGQLSGEQARDIQEQQRMIREEGQLISYEAHQMLKEGEQKIARIREASMRGIMREIRQKVAQLSDQQGYDFVFDKSGKNTNQTSFFLYFENAQDLTSTMIRELNKSAPQASED